MSKKKAETLKEEPRFELAKIQVSNLPELQGWEDRQKAILKENPFVKIEDFKSYEDAKKARTALVSARTDIQKQDKLIAKKLRELRSQAGKFAEDLIAITLPAEEKQQEEVKNYEDAKAREAEEKRIAEEKRKEELQEEIKKTFLLFEEAVEVANLEEISALKEKFETLEAADRERFEDFEFLYLDKLDGARLKLERREAFLIKEEADRKERARLKLQNERLQKIAPVNHFGEPVDLDSLAELSEVEFNYILTVKKDRKEEADKKEAQRKAQEEAERKELEELRAEKEKAQKEKLEARVGVLKDLGFELDVPGVYYQPQTDTSVKDEELIALSLVEFNHFLQDQRAAIKKADEAAAAEEAARMKKELEEKKKREAEEEARKKAEAKRKKALQPDKKKLEAWISSVKFGEEFPELKDEKAQKIASDFKDGVDLLKKTFINAAKNLK